MATLPSANTTVSDTAGAVATGSDVCCVLMPVPISADMIPRLYGSAQAIYDQHGYAEGIEYCARHVKLTGKPILVAGLPIATPGAVSRVDDTGNTGTSVVTVTAGADGVLMPHDGQLKVVSGGTIGTDQIRLALSLDDGRSFIDIRLGTANTLTVPYVGASLAFAAGTLIADDVILEWHGSGPRAATGSIQTARANLAAQMKFFRSAMLIGDVVDSTAAQGYLDELAAYDTENDRYIRGRCSLPSRLPLGKFSTTSTLQFTAGPKTIVRGSGSFLADGFVQGATFTVDGTVSNDGTYTISAVNASTITTVEALVTEGPIAAHTVRLEATSPTKAAFIAEQDAEFAGIGGDAGFRINLDWERGRAISAFTAWKFRYPSGWFANWRAYQHDLHVATWRKDHGILDADLYDQDGDLVEWDERNDGAAACAARFTAMRTWGNGPVGAFIALDLTRAGDGSILSNSAIVDVVNKLCSVCQAMTENAIGRDLTLNADGTLTKQELNTIQTEVNAALELAGTTNQKGEGANCSSVIWTPASDDVFNVPEPVLTGVLEIIGKGYVHSTNTVARVRSGGQ